MAEDIEIPLGEVVEDLLDKNKALTLENVVLRRTVEKAKAQISVLESTMEAFALQKLADNGEEFSVRVEDPEIVVDTGDIPGDTAS